MKKKICYLLNHLIKSDSISLLETSFSLNAQKLCGNRKVIRKVLKRFKFGPEFLILKLFLIRY